MHAVPLHIFLVLRKAPSLDKVYPLSLLAFVATAHALSAPRQPQDCRMETGERRYSTDLERGRGPKEAVRGLGSSGEPVRGQESEEGRKMIAQVAGLDHVFRRHVKPKKQHEIKHLAAVRGYNISCTLFFIYQRFHVILQEAVRLSEVTRCRKIIVSVSSTFSTSYLILYTVTT